MYIDPLWCLHGCRASFFPRLTAAWPPHMSHCPASAPKRPNMTRNMPKPMKNRCETLKSRLETQLGRLSGIVQRRFHHGLCPLRSAFRREEHRHLAAAEHVPHTVAREHDGVTALAFELLRGGRTASEGPQSPAAERRRPPEQPTPGKAALKLILVGRRLQEAVIGDRCPTSSFILGHLRGAMLSGSCC